MIESESRPEQESVSYAGLSKLLSNDEVMAAARRNEHLVSRRTGETTGELLVMIGEAMQRPHDYSYYAFQLDHKHITEQALSLLQQLLDDLPLKYLEIERVGLNVYLRYNILRGQYSLQELKGIDHEAEKI